MAQARFEPATSGPGVKRLEWVNNAMNCQEITQVFFFVFVNKYNPPCNSTTENTNQVKRGPIRLGTVVCHVGHMTIRYEIYDDID